MNSGDWLVGVFIATLIVAMVFVFAIIGALFGAFAGWILSMTFLGPMIQSGLESLGAKSPNLIEIGALLGFVSSFFRNYISNKGDNDK
mgnify:CR=1 FL=1